MGFSLLLHDAPDGADDGPFHLSSASGWKAVGDWVLSLDASAGPVPTLRRLVEDGTVQNTAALAAEVRRAATYSPPAQRSTATTLEHLLELVGVGHAEERASVVGE